MPKVSDGEVCEDGSEMKDDEMAEKDWIKAVGIEDDDDGSEYDVGEILVGDEVEMNEHEDETSTVDEGKAIGICQELELETMLEEYDGEVKILFSLTKLDILKEKKRFC